MSNSIQSKDHCQKIIQSLIRNNGWQLLPENVFINTVLNDEQWNTAETPQTACVNIYCKDALYPACLGTWGPDKQRQGFQELACYMYKWAGRRLPAGIVEDVVQDALLSFYQKMHTCRVPGAILKFATQKIRDAEKKYWKPKAIEISLDIVIDKKFQTKPSGLENALIISEFRYELREAIQRSKMLHPRAQYQFEAVHLRYCECLCNKEISERLEKTPVQVSMLIHRGICKLRSDPHIEQLTKDYDNLW